MHTPSWTNEQWLHQNTPHTNTWVNEEIVSALDITVEWPNDELVNYIFSTEIWSKLEDAIWYALNNNLASCDAIMSLTPGQKRWNWWETSVWPLVSMDTFSFIQHDSMSKDVFVKNDFKKYFLSIHIQRIPGKAGTYRIAPMVLELPAKTTMLPNWYIFVKELNTIEEYTDAERHFL